MTAAVKATPKKAVRQPKKALKEVNILEGLPKPGELKADTLADAVAKAVEAQQKLYADDVRVYQYTPKDTSKMPILLPLNGFEPGDKLWLFDLAQLPLLTQTWRWMQRANVPQQIQRQAQMLDDSEYFAMFNEWFDIMRQLRGAGPKGSLTAEK